MQIDSNDPIVKQSLQRIANVITTNGGEIHPQLIIHHRNENLWISCDAPESASPLLVVPNFLFVPVTQLEWLGVDGLLQYTGSTESLSPVQVQLLADMLIVYNQAEKITRVAERLPTQRLRSDSALLEWLQDAHARYRLPKGNAARQFIDTRLNEMTDGADGATIGYLMPLIDYLNHHPFGPKYERTESGDWLIPVAHPVSGSAECFVRYSKTDCLSNAVWHGYYDPHPLHVAALDCKLQLPKTPPIQICASFAANRKINAPRLERTATGVTLHDVVLEKTQLPTLLILLGLAIRALHRELTQPEAETIANELIQLLVDANIRKYVELQTICSRDKEHFPLRQLFGQVAEHQLSLLRDLRTALG